MRLRHTTGASGALATRKEPAHGRSFGVARRSFLLDTLNRLPTLRRIATYALVTMAVGVRSGRGAVHMNARKIMQLCSAGVRA